VTGWYCFYTVYSGDSNYQGSTDANSDGNVPTNECFQVTPAPTGTVTQQSTSNGQYDLSTDTGGVTDLATITATPTGSSMPVMGGHVDFYYCFDASSEATAQHCTSTTNQVGSDVAITPGSPNGKGTATSSALTPGQIGWYCFYTVYSGDTNYQGSTDANGSGNVPTNECFQVTQAQFKVVKTDTPGNGQPVVPGATIPYTVTISNTGSGAGPAVITDNVPSNLTVSGTPACGTLTGSDTCSVTGSGNDWQFHVSLAAGDSVQVTFSAVLAATDTADAVNEASITSGLCVGSDCSSTVTNPVPNFSVLKTDVPGDTKPVVPGATIPYTVTISNTGDGGGSAVITDDVPSNLTVSGTPACGTLTGSDTCSVTGSGNDWQFHVTLAAGDSVQVTFSAVLAATDTADAVNTASITSGPCNGGNTCTSTVTNPVPDFTVLKSDTPGDGNPAKPGSTIVYTVKIQNVGDGAGSAVITDPVPSLVTVDDTSVTCGTLTGSDTCSATGTGNNVVIHVTLAAGDSVSVTFSATVGATVKTDVVNTATITSGPCNTDTGCSSTVTNPVPFITVVKSSSPVTGTTVVPGQTITYTLAVSNIGSGVADTTVVTDAIPAGSTYVAGSASCGTVPNCTASEATTSADPNGLVTFTLTSVAAGASGLDLTFAVTVNATAVGQIVNVAAFTGAGCLSSTPCPTNQTNHPIPPPTAPQTAPIQGATVVHTGKQWLVWRPLALIGLFFGLGLIVLGELQRRRSRRMA
jgi:uncharacterized repeat protein (TIGR01451 family)/fimbrial isopeptide formation D2 family protein